MQCENPKKIPNGQIVPCGHCLACRQTYSNQWIARFMCEEEAFRRGAFFGTLTYNDESLPVGKNLDEKALALYWKRVKKELQLYNCGFVYTYCGEYGTKFGRPHYHFVAAGFSIDDCATSEQIATFRRVLVEQWQKYNNNSFVYISEIKNAEASIRYLINYTTKTTGYWALKNHETKEEFTARTGRVAPFVRFSHGISKRYFDEHKEELKYMDSLQIGQHKFCIPRYFKKKLDLARNSDDFADLMIETQKYYENEMLEYYKVKSVFDLPLNPQNSLFDLQQFPIFELADVLPQWKNYIYSKTKCRARAYQRNKKLFDLLFMSVYELWCLGYVSSLFLIPFITKKYSRIIQGMLFRDSDYQTQVRLLQNVWFSVDLCDDRYQEWLDIDKSEFEVKELLDRWNSCVCECQKFFVDSFKQAGKNRRAQIEISHLRRALNSKKRRISHD